jgi:DnaK suppressor protein
MEIPMNRKSAAKNGARQRNLIELLNEERDATLARVRMLRKEEMDDAVEPPADDLDLAHSLEEVETDAALIERCDEKLKAIDEAVSRLERGRYGICEKCKQDIPIKRLKALPLAALCVDCEKKHVQRRHAGEGDIDGPSRNVWIPPEERRETVEE